MKESDIKKDILELYSIMYNMANSDYGKVIFSKEILKLLKTPISDIETVISNEHNATTPTKTEIRTEIIEIDIRENAIRYFKENILNIYLSESNKATNSFTAKELKMLYYKIFEIEIHSKKITKSEIIEKIIEYINSEARTDDLAKDLN